MKDLSDGTATDSIEIKTVVQKFPRNVYLQFD